MAFETELYDLLEVSPDAAEGSFFLSSSPSGLIFIIASRDQKSLSEEG